MEEGACTEEGSEGNAEAGREERDGVAEGVVDVEEERAARVRVRVAGPEATTGGGTIVDPGGEVVVEELVRLLGVLSIPPPPPPNTLCKT